MGFRQLLSFTVWTTALLVFGFPNDAVGQADIRTCLVEALSAADDSTTVGELRLLCQQEQVTGAEMDQRRDIPVYERSIIDERLASERSAEDSPFVFTAYQPNYVLWSTMDAANHAPFQSFTQTPVLENNEMIFQVSFKAPIWRNVFGSNVDAYVAYTAKSWWQLFNGDISAPFRETNYQPEIFFRGFANREALGVNMLFWDLGFNHQSNGRAEPLSRSWNRIIGKVGLQLSDNLNIMTRAWYRLPEDDEDDNNPYEYRYFGYGDVRAIWTPNRNTFTAMLRPGTQETSYELTWSYPVSSVFRIYAQYYNGYGDSLIDYDYHMERIGIGIAMNDFLGRY